MRRGEGADEGASGEYGRDTVLAAHHLAHLGLVCPAELARAGERVPARVTPAGRLALASTA
jgi:hypothetical protein